MDVAEPQTNSLSKAEQRKLDSDHLREPLLTELGNDEVRFSVEVGNTCELDSLAIKPRGLVPYWLRTPSIALDD